MVLKVLLLSGNLIQQFASNITCAGNKQVYLFISTLKEFFMKYINSFFYISRGNNSRNISLRGTLGDGSYINSISSHNSKHFSAYTNMVFHIISYKCHNGKVFF